VIVDASDQPEADRPDRPEPGLSDRRRFLGRAGAVGLLVLTGGGAMAYLSDRLGRSGTSTSAATTETTGPAASLTVTDSTPALPVPAPLPADPNADTASVVIGTIELPRLGVTGPIQEGITLTAINRGPSHWPGTAMPGAFGNVVIAGHRTIYTKPFRQLDRLQPGDQVVMTTPEGRFTYAVRGVIIVPGEAIDIATQSYAHTATLFACHPPGSSRQRIVAKLALLGADGQPVDAEAVLPTLDAGSQETDHTLMVQAGDPLSQSAS
jgi:sortase A